MRRLWKWFSRMNTKAATGLEQGPGSGSSMQDVDDITLQLHDKIIRNDIQGCRDMLTAGLDPNKPLTIPQDTNGISTLRVKARFVHTAIIYRRPTVLALLLDAGADPEAVDSFNRRPLQLTVTYWPRVARRAPFINPLVTAGKEEIYFQRCLDDQHNRSQRTLAILLNNGAKADIRCGDSDDSLLHLAARYGIIDCLNSLLRHGVDINAVNKAGETALILALKNKNTKVCEVLICWGADVNWVDPFGRSALHYACQVRRAEKVVKYLINGGAHVNVPDTEGNMPIHIAAKEGTIESIKALLEHDAVADRPNSLMQTALYILLDTPAADLDPRLPVAQRLLGVSLCTRLTDCNGLRPLSVRQGGRDERCATFFDLLQQVSDEPASLFRIALHKTRRCLGYANTCLIHELQLDCPPGLRDLIAW